MACRDLALTSGERDVEVVADLVDRECLAHDLYLAERRNDLFQLFRLDAIDLDVPILVRDAHDLVANTATIEDCSAARGTHCLGEIDDLCWKVSHTHLLYVASVQKPF